jgi:hypothetical protein
MEITTTNNQETFDQMMESNESWADLCDDVRDDDHDPKPPPPPIQRSTTDWRTAVAGIPAGDSKLKQDKLELHSILNCFQSGSRDGGYFIHIGEKLRDPRFHNVRDYYDHVKDNTFCLREARRSIGGFGDDMTPECRDNFMKLLKVLDNVRGRLYDVLASSSAVD